ncbi:MAG TPA: NADH-quinone oxidoreductase subunit C, partial [Protaetiibacter sp.]|nr:NADH-quinone oxidoreductase subunit C [Protaetiibacter sp.]
MTEKSQESGLTPGEIELAQATSTGAEPGETTAKVVGLRKGMFGATQGGDTTGYGGLRRPILVAGETNRPFGGYFDELADSLERA